MPSSQIRSCLESIAFLGHVVPKDGIMVDLVKIEAIWDWARPTLSHLDVTFEWSDECELSFWKLKELLTTDPILTLSIEGECFTVYYDAYDVGLGCVLDATGPDYFLCVEGA
ncbi:hypothetical protein MTR67_007127 [Solanum verrucosum]|uniref:Reverse transcriptase/retrotransposon-derived protein RNase H-like domain-containing protein n=1 Tax=Solanum verrucosum TaxID=315347 RepID=A0AAF0PZK4_SOLVR|nr:hypothetical protein MTR67_007127 [Solanum verrucosum]